jgi:hypothetical protein
VTSQRVGRFGAYALLLAVLILASFAPQSHAVGPLPTLVSPADGYGFEAASRFVGLPTGTNTLPEP